VATSPQLLSGARGLLYINNLRLIAFVTNVSVNRQASVRAVHTFGSPAARSVEPLSTGVSLTIGKVIPMNTPSGGAVNTSDIAMGIESVITDMLTASDITVTLLDQVTGQIVSDVRHCRFSGGSMNLSAQQLAQGSISLVGIYDAAGGQVADPVGL
jgi:hypothetical protein